MRYFIFIIFSYFVFVTISFLVFLFGDASQEVAWILFVIYLISTVFILTQTLKNIKISQQLKLLKKEKDDIAFKMQIQEKMLFLQSRQASLGELIGNVSHQWKEPLGGLGAILANLQATLILSGEVTKEKLNDSIEKSYKIIYHLSDTISVFYRFFRSQKSDKKEFNIYEEISNIVIMVSYSMKIEHINLRFDCDNDIFAYGDRGEFVNAILNIILNAKDILIERKVKDPFIELKVIKEDKNITITLQDNGGGIYQEPIEKIFEYSISSKEDSTGIGLFIVKNIIENRLHGTISVQNNEKGALFTITLPTSSGIINNNQMISYDVEETAYDRIARLEKELAKQSELEKTLRQWEDIFRQTHWGVSVHKGMSNTFEMVNPAFYKMYGYTANELKTMTVNEFFSPESLEILPLKQKEAFEKSFVSFEAINLRKDGSRFPVNVDITVIKNEYDEILYRIANIRDITEQKEIANALKKSEEAFRAMVENSPDVIMRYDRECRRTYINPLGLLLMGKPEDELLGKTPREFSPLPNLEEFEKAFDTVVTESKEVKIEGEFVIPNGERRWGEQRIVPELNQDGEVVSVLVIGRDITELRKAHRELLFKNFAMETINEAIFLVDNTGKLKYVNQGACKALGYTKEELLLLDVGDIDPDWPTYRWGEHWDVLKQQKTMTMELRHKRKNGSTFQVEVVANYIDYEGVGYNMALVRDISERKVAEENLLLKEFALNQISEAVFLIDENSNFHYLNETAYRSLGYDEEELMQLNVIAIDSNMTREKWVEHWNDMKQRRSISLFTHHQRKDGIIFPIEVSANYFEYKGVAYNLAVTRDITERKKAENEIKEREEKFSKLFMSSPAAVSVTSIHRGIYLEVNESFLYFTKYTRDEVVGKSSADLQLFANPDERAEFFRRVLEDGMVRGFEFQYRAKDGTTGYGVAYATLLIIQGESCVLSHSYDINASKQLELVNTAINSTSEAVYITDETFSIIYVNDGACNMLGYTKDELTAMKVYEIDAIHSLENLNEFKEIKRLNQQVVLETKHKMKNGNIIDVQIAGSSFSFHDKTVFLSVVKDITQKKEYEEQLKLLDTAINSASDAVYIVDQKRSIRYVNDTACRMLGYTVGEFLVMKVDDIDAYMSVSELEKVKERVDFAHETTFITKHRAKTGAIFDVEITATKFIFNNVDMRLSIVKDITQQIRYEEEIKELNKTLEHKVIERTKELQGALEFNKSIIQAIPDILFEISKEGVYLNIWARDDKLLATQKELLLGKNLKDILPPTALEVSLKTMKEVDMYGSSLGNSYKLDLPDGEHWFELHTTKKEPEGTYLALARDITQRKKAQNALLELNATLEDKVKERTLDLQKSFELTNEIINTLPDLLFEMDIKGNYINIWTQNKELLVQQKDALLGNNIYNVLSKQSADTILEAFNEADLKKVSVGKTITIDLPDGQKQFGLSISKKSDGNYLILSRELLGK
jgi:PAS domain S-box-containing protein